MSRQISRDDLQDTLELAEKLASAINKCVSGNHFDIASCAIASAVSFCVINQSTSLEEAQAFKTFFIKHLSECLDLEINIRVNRGAKQKEKKIDKDKK